MNIEISKHGLNFGEDLEYVATFIKGKGKIEPENYRILTRGVKTGEERLLLSVVKNRVEITNHGYKIKPIPVLGT
jgi:hypothetical protein